MINKTVLQIGNVKFLSREFSQFLLLYLITENILYIYIYIYIYRERERERGRRGKCVMINKTVLQI